MKVRKYKTFVIPNPSSPARLSIPIYIDTLWDTFIAFYDNIAIPAEILERYCNRKTTNSYIPKGLKTGDYMEFSTYKELTDCLTTAYKNMCSLKSTSEIIIEYAVTGEMDYFKGAADDLQPLAPTQAHKNYAPTDMMSTPYASAYKLCVGVRLLKRTKTDINGMQRTVLTAQRNPV